MLLRTVSRRQLLAGAGGLLVGGLTACDASNGPSPVPGSSAPSPTPVPTVSPTSTTDASLRSASAARVRTLLASYDGALTGRDAADPARTQLLALRADHAAHLQALTGEVPPPAPELFRATPAATASPRAGDPVRSGADPSTSPKAPAPPLPPAAVPVTALLAAERLAEAGNAGDVAAASGPLARLLASVAACEASHEVALGAVAAA